MAIGPVLTILGKLGSGIGTVIKILGTFKTALGVAIGATTSTTTAVGGLAKVFIAISSPIGLAITGIMASIGLISIAVNNATKDTKEAFSNMGNAASEFIAGIDTAKSHLSEFNSTLFASSEEQQKLQNDMQEVQDGITLICRTASKERRDYTQKEITQLDEYFTKLRELKDREIEIQQSISKSIAQQAEQNSQTFQGSLEEYKINSQEWINTAQEQAQAEIDLINERTTEEIALLQQRYGDKATLENEEYAREYNNAIEQKDKLIAQANEQVAKVNSAFAEGYLERSKQESDWYNTFNKYNEQIEAENKRHNEMMQDLESENFNIIGGSTKLKDYEMKKHSSTMQEIWNEIYKNMNESEEKQLGVWLAMVAQTELYGGEIDEETRRMVDNILASYDSMPDNAKETIGETMAGMLNGMKEEEPSLFAKASSIANGILSRLKKAFDIHSPSKKTKEIFEYVMEGAEVGLDKKERSLYKDIDRIAKEILTRFSSKDLYNKMQTTLDFETQKLNTNLTTNAIMSIQKEDDRQTILNSIDNNREIQVNSTLNLDGKVVANTVNKVNARQKLQYGLA